MPTRFGIPQQQGPRRPHLPLRAYTSNPGGGIFGTLVAGTALTGSLAQPAPSVKGAQIRVAGPGKLRRIPPAYTTQASTIQLTGVAVWGTVPYGLAVSYLQQVGMPKGRTGPSLREPFNVSQFKLNPAATTVPLVYATGTMVSGTVMFGQLTGTGVIPGIATTGTVLFGAATGQAAGTISGVMTAGVAAFGSLTGVAAATGMLANGSVAYGQLQLSYALSGVLPYGVVLYGHPMGNAAMAGVTVTNTVAYGNVAEQTSGAISGYLVTGTALTGQAIGQAPLSGLTTVSTVLPGQASGIGALTGTLVWGTDLYGQAASQGAMQGAGVMVTGTVAYGLLIVDPIEFGYASINVETQTDVPTTIVTIIEDSSCFVNASFFNPQGEPMLPQNVQYRLDDVKSDTNIIPWTDVDPAGTVRILIPPSANKIIDLAVTSEDKQVLFQITDDFNNVFEADVVYTVKKVSGLS